MTRVSVVLPVLDAAPYLETSLQSLLDQTRPDVELIVVEHGPRHPVITDALSLGEQAPWRLTLMDAPAPCLSEALNAGAAAASGELVMFLNAQDAYLPQRVATFARAYENTLRPEVFWGFSGVEILDPKNPQARTRDMEQRFSQHAMRGIWSSELLSGHNLVMRAGNLAVARALFAATGGFAAEATGAEWALALELSLYATPFVPGRPLYAWVDTEPEQATVTGGGTVRAGYLEQRRRHLASESLLSAGLPGAEYLRARYQLLAPASL
jgi:glycosyltransferase involved in cell wall biosynthesis